MNKKLIKFCAVILLGAIVLQVNAKDIYVKAGATGRGKKNKPYGQLWKAIDRAIRGDVIHVTAGTYNAKGGSGCFTIKVPNLTIAGGYDSTFSTRNPFKNFTILERAADYKGDWTGLGEGIIDGKNNVDCGGLIIDGLVLNSASRNAYKPNGDINPKKSWKGSLIHLYSKNIKIRNCFLLNAYGNGIYNTWYGEKNEVTNTFILNTFYCGLSTRSAQPDSIIKIKNNTIAFCWFQPGKGGGNCSFVGNQGQTIYENNIFAFAQTEDAGGFGVLNGFGNEDTIMKDNIFFQCQGGYYKYMDDDKKNLIVWKPEELEDLNENCEDYMLSEAEGNSSKDPQFMPDVSYFESFTNTIASKPGKLKMNTINQWRRSVGLPLQAENGTGRKNWGMKYPLDKIVPNLISKVPNIGVQINGPFEQYASKGSGVTSKKYKKVDFDSFKKGSPEYKAYSNTPVSFKAGLGAEKSVFELKETPKSDYNCYQLLKSGEKNQYTRNFVYGYILKGSKAEKKWNKYYKKKSKYNKKGGILIKGTATYFGKDSYSYPVGIIIDKVSKK